MRILLAVIVFFLFALIILILWARSPVARFKITSTNDIAVYPDVLALAPKKKIRLISYNLGYASGNKNGLGSVLNKSEIEQHLQEAFDALVQLDADIICFQEIDFLAHRSHDIDQLDWLGRKLGFGYAAYAVNWNNSYVPYPYWPPQLHFGHLVSGQGILSRYPLSDHEITVFPKPPHYFWYNWFYLDRLAQKIKITVGSDVITLWNVHLEAFHEKTRIQQAHLLRELVDSNPSKHKIVAGDFNDPQENNLDAIGTMMNDEASNWKSEDAHQPKRYTFPSWNPEQKIDYILYNKTSIRLIHSGIIQSEASDHLPVWADLEWN